MTVDDDRPGTKPTPGPVPAELNARRTAAVAVLGDYKAALASAPVTRSPGHEWMFRLADALAMILEALPDMGNSAAAEPRAAVGPFKTEREALALPAVQAIHEAFDRDPGAGKMAPHTHKMLVSACVAAGVELGGHDRRILLWLSGWEPQTAAVIAGLIGRAHAAGRADAAEDGRRLGEIRTLLDAFSWERDDRQFALDAINRIASPDWDGTR